MDARQDPQTTDDNLLVLEPAAKRFRGQFDQQATNENNEPMELTNTTCTNLQHLIEDCLLKIFEVKSMAPLDLCSLAETCKLFERIVQRVFPKDLSISVCYGGHHRHRYDVKSTKYSGISRELLPKAIERIFKHLGPGLAEVKLLCNYYAEPSNFLVNLVAEHCPDRLEHLKMVGLEITGFVVHASKLKAIFKRLKILDLYRVNIGADKTLLVDLDSLIELRVCFISRAILENIFPKLERLVYRDYQGEVKNDHPLLTFLSRHRTLKTLLLAIVYIYDAVKMNVLKVIGQSCEALEELTLEFDTSTLRPLQTLQSLKTLNLWSVECDDLKFFASLTNLRELHLEWCELPTDQFAALAQLTKLHIREINRADPDDVVEIIRQLINLEEFRVAERRFRLDEETFSKIVDVVKVRPQELTLKCKFDFVRKNCDEGRKVKLIQID